jgi:AcrR family transcriptional regulator
MPLERRTFAPRGCAVPTQEERRQKARGRLLAAAYRVFADEGYAAASLDRIAREAGYTKGTIYLYFTDKAELFLAVMEERLARQRRALLDALSWDRPIAETVAACLDAACGGDEDPRAWCSLAMEFTAHAMRGNDAVRRRIAEMYTGFRRFLAGLLDEGKTRGVVDPTVDSMQMAAVLVACTDGLAIQRTVDDGSGPAPPTPGALAPLLVRLFGVQGTGTPENAGVDGRDR